MRLLITGGRYYADMDTVFRVLDKAHAHTPISVLIHGGARGADTLAHWWAVDRGVTPLRFPANWTKHGRAAGVIRNQQMITEGRPDAYLAFPGGKGTADMVARARAQGIRPCEIRGQID